MLTPHAPFAYPTCVRVGRLLPVVAGRGLEKGVTYILSGLSTPFVAMEQGPPPTLHSGLTAADPCWQLIETIWSGQGD
jgi:hypothetical protein